MELPNEECLRIIWRKKTNYKSLVILETDCINETKDKGKSKKEKRRKKKNLKRTRNLLETKLCGRNLIKRINIWVVDPPPVRYAGPFLKWIREELRWMNHRTGKLMTDDAKGLTPEGWHRLYVKKKGGRGLASIEDCMAVTIHRNEEYTIKSKERLIIATSNSSSNRNNSRTNRKIAIKNRENKTGKKTSVWILQATN